MPPLQTSPRANAPGNPKEIARAEEWMIKGRGGVISSPQALKSANADLIRIVSSHSKSKLSLALSLSANPLPEGH